MEKIKGKIFYVEVKDRSKALPDASFVVEAKGKVHKDGKIFSEDAVHITVKMFGKGVNHIDEHFGGDLKKLDGKKITIIFED